MPKQKRATTANVQALFDVMDGTPADTSDTPSVAVVSEPPPAAEAEAARLEPEPAQVHTPAQDDEPILLGNPASAEAVSSLHDAEQPVAVPTRKNRETMENVALVFLEDALARRLAVAWPVCDGNEDEWFDAAGFTSKQYAEASRMARALRLNGICREGGVTDPLALQYIQAVIARPLSAAAKKKP
jgi:hypothetical protein